MKHRVLIWSILSWYGLLRSHLLVCCYIVATSFQIGKAICLQIGLVSKSVIRIKIQGNQAVVQETIPVGQRVRDVRQGKDGFVYILTDEQAGQLIRIEPS